MNKFRILMTTRSASLQDGINRHIINVVPELNKLPDIECAVCVVQPAGEFGELLQGKGVKVYSLNAPNGHAWRCYWAFYKAVRDFKPNLMHDAVTGFAIRVVSKICFPNLPWVSTFHGCRYDHDIPKMKKQRETWWGRFLDLNFKKVFYVAPDCMRIDARYGLYTAEIRRPGLNPYDFDKPLGQGGDLRRELGIADDVPLIGTACRIADQKRPDLFTKVMCGVLEKVPRAHAVIIGDGPRMDLVKSIINEHPNIRSRIHLLGYRQNVIALDQDLDCFVMTSEFEGLPTSALEAIAAGAILAVMKIPSGVTDLVNASEANGGFAVVSNFGDIEGMIDNVVQLLEHCTNLKEMVETARRVCRAEFGMSRAIEYFYAGYREMMP